MVTVCSVLADAPSVTSRPSATAAPAHAPAAADRQLCLPPITASSVAVSPLTEIYGADARTDWEGDAERRREKAGTTSYARATLIGLPRILFREAAGIECVDGELRASRKDQVGDGAAHGRAIHNALAGRARAHIHVLDPGDTAEQEQAVGRERAQARGLVDDLGIGHRGKHRHQGGPDLLTGLRRGFLVEAGFLLRGACPEEAVRFCGGVVVAPPHGAGHGRSRRLEAEDLALERAHLDGRVDPARCLAAPWAQAQHDCGAGDLAALEDHARDAPARATQA